MMVSKETFECQEYHIGEEMLMSGSLKFDSIWSDVINFAHNGHSAVKKSITL